MTLNSVKKDSIKLCFILTDAISVNILMKGQLEYLSKLGCFDITVICGGNESEINALRDRKVCNVKFVPIVREPSLLRDIKALFRLISFLSKNKFDLIVNSTPKALLLGSIASYLTRQTARVSLVRGRVYENYTGVKRLLFSMLDSLSFLTSNKVVFISKSLMSVYIKENIVSCRKSLVLGHGSSNGVDVDCFRPLGQSAIQDLRAQLGFEKDDFLVLSVGRVRQEKGVHEFFEIVNKIENPKIKFLMVGSIEDEHSKQLVNQMNKLPRFKHFPHTKHVNKFFQISDIHLFLSHREGFGNVAIEAAASGVPTLAFDVTGVRDSVNNGVSGKLFSTGDTDSISKNIIDLFDIKAGGGAAYPLCSEWANDFFSNLFVWETYAEFYYRTSATKRCNN